MFHLGTRSFSILLNDVIELVGARPLLIHYLTHSLRFSLPT